ncbi:AfsR/SARP family transcriptional regulator [Nonomuraea diastatica]|uniref:AfsR/SARP family transcriptional regulator n=1 Tax=Nonomuraea diastatica TaxID=1848329 RepID=UPI00140846C2
MRAQERWFEVSIKLGEPVDVIPDLQAAVDAHPTHERFWAQLILALSQGGRQAEALEKYWMVRDQLRTELGLDPGPEIRQAHKRISRHPPRGRRRPRCSRSPVFWYRLNCLLIVAPSWGGRPSWSICVIT